MASSYTGILPYQNKARLNCPKHWEHLFDTYKCSRARTHFSYTAILTLQVRTCTADAAKPQISQAVKLDYWGFVLSHREPLRVALGALGTQI